MVLVFIDMKNNIKYFALFGERCSGTKYIEKLLVESGLEKNILFGGKHWFLPKLYIHRPELNNSTDLDGGHGRGGYLKPTDPKSDEVLFVVIARNPYQWVASMYNTPHQMDEMEYDDRYSFLTNKYYCTHPNNPILKESFIEEAENIIDIRNKKHTHWMNLSRLVKHFVIINYDDLPNEIKKLPVDVDISDFKLKNDYILEDREIEFIKNNLNNEIDELFY